MVHNTNHRQAQGRAQSGSARGHHSMLCPVYKPTDTKKHQNAGAQSASACHRACEPALGHSWGMASTHSQSLSGSSHTNQVKCCHTHTHGRASACAAFRQKTRRSLLPHTHTHARHLMLQTRQAAEAADNDAPTAINCTRTSARSDAHTQRNRGLYAQPWRIATSKLAPTWR